jgi:preprotein translocase subunit SecA
MAGRGTDIRLGGHDGANYQRVADLGGLYVIGTNRHESRRIDDQLRGRAGRQGDPGSSRFFVCLEDDLLVRYNIDDLIPLRLRPARQSAPIDHPGVNHAIAHAQRIIEGQNGDIRRTLWRYSFFLEQQRRVFSTWRAGVLQGEFRRVLSERVPEDFRRACSIMGDAALRELERRLTLQAIDNCWSDHLAKVDEIRDGIHLAEVGGLSPIEEFQKAAASSFLHVKEKVDDDVVGSFLSFDIASCGGSIEVAGIRGPSSTWTYLVSDRAFTDRLAAQLISRRNIGFSASAAVFGPLLLLWAFSRRFRRRDSD